MSAHPTAARPHGRLAPELTQALMKGRSVLMAAAVFSCVINVLALASPLYMLQVYDRVIPAHSVPTLVGLTIALVVMFVAFGILDVIRSRLMSRLAAGFETSIRGRVIGLVTTIPLRAGGSVDAQQPLRDLDQVRSFASSGGPTALFDMPWMPFYLALVWMLHPWLGLLATLGGLVLIGVTVLTDFRARGLSRDVVVSGGLRSQMAEAARRNAAAIRSMGMRERLLARWAKVDDRHLADQTAAADLIGTYGSISRVFRMLLQSAVLGLGAYLVIDGQASGGVMISASILVSRALAPIEVALANWRGLISARQSLARLSMLLLADPERPKRLPLPKPVERLDVDGVFVAPPGQSVPVVANASFSMPRGTAVGVIGPSGSGKSSLIRALIGAWPVLRGTVRLDGATLDQWSEEDLGGHIGYLPQEFELIEGTAAENIARFEPDAPAEAVIEAARAAGVHDLIVRLPKGYDTQIGESGTNLSAGQRQRVALARALYRDPFLVVLDEPNSNLDADGERALERAIAGVRRRGGIVVIVAHRPSALAGVDYLLHMTAGQPPVFGTKTEIMQKLAAKRAETQGERGPSPTGQTAPAPSAAPAGGSPRLMIISDGT